MSHEALECAAAYIDAFAAMDAEVKPLKARVNVPVVALQLMLWT